MYVANLKYTGPAAFAGNSSANLNHRLDHLRRPGRRRKERENATLVMGPCGARDRTGRQNNVKSASRRQRTMALPLAPLCLHFIRTFRRDVLDWR
jgi:hypothetical protein